jgi:hypothetical protein
MKLYGYFGADQGTVTVGGGDCPVKSWAEDQITCTIDAGATGDVQVKVRGLKSNLRPLTQWTLPLKYTWNLTGGVFNYTGTADIRYRLDVAGYRKKPGEAPTYLRRGAWPQVGSTITVSLTGNVNPCALTGGTVAVATLPANPTPSIFLQAPLIFDANTQTGVLGLAFGFTDSPWKMICPSVPPSPMSPSFGTLQYQTSFYRSQEEDAAADLGPFPAMTVTYGTDMTLQDGSYSSSQGGTMKVEWTGSVQTSPPRPADAGI